MTENVVGNVYDKYGTRNPVARALMRGFLGAVVGCFDRVAPRSVLEVGCGEGRLAQELLARAARPPERFEACDLALDRLASGLDPRLRFREASVYELPFADRSFELVVCCEVLEHLERPLAGLRELRRVAERAVILSTPREPLWRALNLARGKYWGALGNTPGHIQHSGGPDLVKLAGSELRVMDVLTPVPWTVVLGVPRAEDDP